MKKYIALVISMIFVLGFAASAFALHSEIPTDTQAVVAKGVSQITLGGEIRVRGEVRSNVQDFSDDTKTATAAAAAGVSSPSEGSNYDTRVRLTIDAKVTPNTSGRIAIETGNGGNSDTDNWGVARAGTGATGIYSQGNAQIGGIGVYEAWILHTGSGLLGMPAGLKVGHMPLKLGYGLFFDHTRYGDDAIVAFIDPTKELHIGVLNAKFSEGIGSRATDTAAQKTAKGISDSNDSDAYVFVLTYKVNKDSNISTDITYVNDQNGNLGLAALGLDAGNDVHFWNLGLRGDTNISGFGIKLDVEVQGGKVTDTGGDDIKFAGRAALLSLSYTLAPVKITLEGAYGSGSDSDDTKIKNFVTSLGNDVHYTYVYEYRSATANAEAGLSNGLNNTTYLKLGFDADLTKDIAANLSAYWLRATKVPVDGMSKSIGTEVDAKVSYKIDKNLMYWVEGGYLFAGNHIDDTFGTNDTDNAFAVRHGLQLNF